MTEAMITNILLGVVTALSSFALHAVLRHDSKLDRLDVALFGEKGNNGINGAVRGILEHQNEQSKSIDDKLAMMNARLNVISERLNNIDEVSRPRIIKRRQEDRGNG